MSPAKKKAAGAKKKASSRSKTRRRAAGTSQRSAARKAAKVETASASPKRRPGGGRKAGRSGSRRPDRRVAQRQIRRSSGDRRSKLGAKFLCFSCEAKFYDLNKPEPICPRCGSDQRQRPSASSAPAPRATGRRAASAVMAPLLDDDDSGTRNVEEVDLGVEAADDSAEDFLDDGLGDAAEDETEEA